MAEDKFKLPRSSYEELCKIVKAYGRMSGPATLDDVAKVCAMNKTAVSANNAFLTNVELIEVGRAKIATDLGRSLAKALEHELPEEIQGRWADVVDSNDFLDKMAAAVKIRGKMESSSLESHIAYSAGEAKSSPVMTGARTVVDILRAAGVVRESDGLLVTGTVVPAKAVTPETTSASPQQSPSQGTAAKIIDAPIMTQSGRTSLHIELRIDAKPSELEGLGEKIRKLLKEIENLEQPGDGAEASEA